MAGEGVSGDGVVLGVAAVEAGVSGVLCSWVVFCCRVGVYFISVAESVAVVDVEGDELALGGEVAGVGVSGSFVRRFHYRDRRAWWL